MDREWVVNASPLISLGRIDHLSLLGDLCGELIIPEGVAKEAKAGPRSDPACIWLRGDGRRFVRPVPRIEPAVASWDHGLGESQVLSLCHGSPTKEAILDDGPARRCAAALGIPVRGTLAVIILAKHGCLVPQARPLFEQLVAAGLRADERVLRRALQLAGEERE